MIRHFGFLKTTAIGGLIFLLPLIVIGALVGQVAQIVLLVAKIISGWVPVNSVADWTAVILAALAVVLLMCFAAGLVARRKLAKRFSKLVENTLMMLFPRYTIIKAQMAGSMGQPEIIKRLKPVLVRFHDCSRVGFEVDRAEGQLVAVYLPGSPDPWMGSVVFLAADRVEPLPTDFSETTAIFERLGRDSLAVLSAPRP